MAKKYDYNVGDIILNRNASTLFLIVESKGTNLKLARTINGIQKDYFKMSKVKFHEQLHSDRGNTELQYFKVLK